MGRRRVGARCCVCLAFSGVSLLEVHRVPESLLPRLVLPIPVFLIILANRAQSRPKRVASLLFGLTMGILLLRKLVSPGGRLLPSFSIIIVVPLQQGVSLIDPRLLRLPLHQHLVLFVYQALELTLLEIAHQDLLLL